MQNKLDSLVPSDSVGVKYDKILIRVLWSNLRRVHAFLGVTIFLVWFWRPWNIMTLSWIRKRFEILRKVAIGVMLLKVQNLILNLEKYMFFINCCLKMEIVTLTLTQEPIFFSPKSVTSTRDFDTNESPRHPLLWQKALYSWAQKENALLQGRKLFGFVGLFWRIFLSKWGILVEVTDLGRSNVSKYDDGLNFRNILCL